MCGRLSERGSLGLLVLLAAGEWEDGETKVKEVSQCVHWLSVCISERDGQSLVLARPHSLLRLQETILFTPLFTPGTCWLWLEATSPLSVFLTGTCVTNL